MHEQKNQFSVCIQQDPFDLFALQQSLLSGEHQEGAVATFTGYVRNNNDDRSVSSLELEHYPGMTEKCIEDILLEAGRRWPISAGIVVHRVGLLAPGDPIVWVGIASGHRGAAFSACEYVMDYLKTRAPFWKKEVGEHGASWVDARESDHAKASSWTNSDDN
ncbi:MAG: molybdopterin synthase catalytic subunit MoaE [Halioglobus sp.]